MYNFCNRGYVIYFAGNCTKCLLYLLTSSPKCHITEDESQKITEAVIKSSHGTDLVRAALSVNNTVDENWPTEREDAERTKGYILSKGSFCSESNWGVKRDAGRCVAIICSVG
ncbi:hypothetical protein Tco_0283762, partial [Tanacetum coccineum]